MGFLSQAEYPISGAVLRARGDIHHFQVVLVGHFEGQHTRVVASLYSSVNGAWGDLISTPLPSDDSGGLVPGRATWEIPAVMIGNSLYWSWFVDGSSSYEILEFDLDRESLAWIPVPGEVSSSLSIHNYSVIPADGGGLGFLFLSGFSAQLWNRKTDCDGIASWVLERTIALDKLLSIHREDRDLLIVGFAEQNNMVLLWRSIGVFTVQLESLQFKKLPGSGVFAFRFSPFEGVYTAGISKPSFLIFSYYIAQYIVQVRRSKCFSCSIYRCA
jgi:hypothetical protein